MTATSLSTTESTRLLTSMTNSSRSIVKDVMLNSIKPNLINSQWTNSRNRYLIETLDRIKHDCATNTFRDADLKEYITASTVLHCKDGWDYFSSAVQEVLSGNFHNAIHMSYYAELRAAMAFLASDGIGIFNNKHVIIDAAGNIRKIPITRGTHDFAWFAIQSWANVPAKTHVIFDTIEIAGKSISDWLIAAGTLIGSPATSHLAADWLKKWSLDLALVSKDHTIRNDVSYRPQEIKKRNSYISDVSNELKFIINQWKLCEPVSSEDFQLLDYYLLRNVLIQRYFIHHGKNPTTGRLRSYINGIMSNLGLSSNPYLLSVLTKEKSGGQHPLLRAANLKSYDSSGTYRPLSILSRAFLLLRLATASTKEILNYASVDYSDLQFWWEKIGDENGFWDKGNYPNPLSDLWSDIDTSIRSVDVWVGANPGFDADHLIRNNPYDLHLLPQFKRAYLWGLGL